MITATDIDLINEFLSESIKLNSEKQTTFKNIYENYTDYCKKQKKPVPSKKMLSFMLREVWRNELETSSIRLKRSPCVKFEGVALSSKKDLLQK